MSARSRNPSRRRDVGLLVAALAVALSFLFVDTHTRLRAIRAATEERFTDYPAPARDAASPSGYELGQHRLILPGLGVDAYHWILQTERAEEEDLLRLRRVDYDDAPDGREVHWAAPMRWWASALAAADRVRRGDASAPPPLERVIPWANTLLLAILIVAAALLTARRLGPSASALFTVGSVSTYPFYEYFVAGYFDHHGLVTFCSALSVLSIFAGGAGWIRSEVPERGAAGASPAARLPRRDQARRWFLGSAVASAVSLWLSAATAVPVLIGVGVAALVGTAWMARGAPAVPGAVIDPTLWRIWGLAGGALSLVFYAVEYAPGHLGSGLEVNHPLYALAWMAGGDLLYRVAARATFSGPVEPRSPMQGSYRAKPGRARLREGGLLLLDAVLVVTPAAAVLLAPGETFRIADPFLWTLHTSFIQEFVSLPRHLAVMRFSEIAAGVSLVPLVSLAICALLWSPAVGSTAAWRALLVAALATALAFLFVVARGLIEAAAGGADDPGAAARGASTVGALVITAGALAAFVVGVRARVPLPHPERCRLAFVLVPPLLPLALSLGQVRWLGVSSALWLVAMTGAVAALAHLAEDDFLWTARRRVAAAAMLGLLLLPYPVFALKAAARSTSGLSGTTELHQLITREVAHLLRARIGSDSAVVFSSPTTTTRLIYFGGFRGVGTLYWENLDGLRSATDIYTARTAEELRVRLEARGVTHLVFFSWDGGLESLRLARLVSKASEKTGEAHHGFVSRLAGDPLLPAGLPSWLVPLAFPLPDAGPLRGEHVAVFEVTPDLPREMHLVRLAQYYRAIDAPDFAERALHAALEARPAVPALAQLAQLQHLRRDRIGFDQSIAQLRAQLDPRASMELVDRIHTIVALGLAGDMAEVSRQTRAALAMADEREVRRTPANDLGTLVGVSLGLGLDPREHRTLGLAVRLLPASERSRLGL